MRSAIRLLTIVGSLILVFGLVPASSVQGVPGPKNIDVTWSVSYNSGSDLYDYSYTVTNVGGGPVDLHRLTVTEAAGHGGIHHETDIVCAAGPPDCSFQYDVAFGLEHNYSWFFGPDIPAGGSVTVGFSDPDGPYTASLRVNFDSDAPFTDSAISDLVPAPRPQGGNENEVGPINLPPPYPPGSFKAWSREGPGVAEPTVGGFNYKYFLRNTGNTTIGPDVNPASDNHGDYYVNEHPSHAGIHHEQGIEPDNLCAASGFSFDSAGHVPTIGPAEPLPNNVDPHHYYWEGLGDGACPVPAGWEPGTVLTLGFFDPHPPGRVSSAGRVHGSTEIVEEFTGPTEMVLVPALPTGGTTELLVDRSDAASAGGSGGGSDSTPYATLAGGVAAAVVAVAAGGWYARRRWLR